MLILPAKVSEEVLAAKTQELVTALQAEYVISTKTESRVAEVAPVYDAPRPSEAAWRIFEIAAKNWFREMTQVRGEFGGTSGEEFRRLVDSLAKFDYGRLLTAKTFMAGGQIKFLLPTPLGIQKLRDAHVKSMEVRGDSPHGEDGTHIFYQNRIAQKLATNGWTVEIEQALSEKRVDVGAIKGDVRHAYEVVNEGVEKETHNLVADLDEGWHHVWFCVGNEQTKRELKQLIQANCPVRISHCSFARLGDFR